MRYPIIRATGSLSGQSGEVYQDINTDTGGGILGNAVERAGRTVSKVESVVYGKKRIAELIQFTTEAGEEVARTVLGFKTNKDESTYQGLMDQSFNKLRQKEPKNPGARQDYRTFLGNLKSKYNGIVEASVVERVEEDYNLGIANRQAIAEMSGDLGPFKAFLNAEVNAKPQRMSEEDRDLRIIQAQPAADKRAGEIKANVFEQAIQDHYFANGEDLAATLKVFGKVGAEDKYGLSAEEAQRVISVFEHKLSIEKQRNKEQFEVETNQVNAKLIEDTYINKVKGVTDILEGVSRGYLTPQQGESHIKLRGAKLPTNLDYDTYGTALDIVNEYNSSALTMKQARNKMLPLLKKLPEGIGKGLFDQVSNPIPDWVKTPQGLQGDTAIKAFYEDAIKGASGPEEKSQWAQSLSYTLRDWALYNRTTNDSPEQRGERLNNMLSASLTPSMTRKFFESMNVGYGKMKATPRDGTGVIELEVVPESTESEIVVLFKNGKSYDIPRERVEEALNTHGFTRKK